MPSSLPLPLQEFVVPDNLSGTVAIFVTSDDTPLSGDIQSRATASGKIVAGPAMVSVVLKNPYLPPVGSFGKRYSSVVNNGQEGKELENQYLERRDDPRNSKPKSITVFLLEVADSEWDASTALS
ncbi:hypothetical protein EVG20_g3877 [Dentipellis fragilis]|uniref:Uncharacterized protein n=1 Tax=Dentipellis fragilis TaxID=205917 RepID=A0A4Y9Z107_9AGAM|nr:hypothetical protein EVG20_g3877 [Dentipellis fragilis]